MEIDLGRVRVQAGSELCSLVARVRDCALLRGEERVPNSTSCGFAAGGLQRAEGGGFAAEDAKAIAGRPDPVRRQ